MAKRKLSITTTVIILVVSALALTLSTFAAVTISQNLASSGAISVSPNMGIYSDAACTVPISSISWGTLAAGGTNTQTVYIKNTGSGVSLTLSMATSNWTPAAANGPIAITWNKEGTRLSPSQSTAANITLTVSPSIVDITTFSVQISITGTE